ncbi:hypothetical protein CVT24_005753 [Panaeolus cyanescens]|uniref:Uncharacterized protein n=1 Tax=Panaeolus cyanescens TaxID=181874 RepID=A0A409V977_9AGAR|nr:hypothetical protein CVT24_005753 [Panaeolus cyanescens]
MSAMLESYDMQMHDYPTDLDIQMHPSSSDQWFHDESKMEEDLPHRTDPSMKADQFHHEKPDFPIEVEMDSSLMESDAQVTEYEMLDGDFMHESATTELVDVEVLDASLVHTPAVLPLQIHNLEPTPTPQYSLTDVPISSQPSAESIPQTLPEASNSLDTTATTSFQEVPPPSLEIKSSSVEPTEPFHAAFVDTSLTNTSISHETDPTTVPAAEDEGHAVAENSAEETAQSLEEPLHHQVQDWSEKPAEEQINHPQADNEEEPEAQAQAPDSLVVPQMGDEVVYHDIPDSTNVQVDDTENIPPQSVGDPHEISEGVFIEPPPPVVMSLPQTDTHATFFTSSESEVHEGTPVIFQHLPTLYYEPLLMVFEALRQEPIVQNLPAIEEAELVMDILSLQLRISEDNIYSREISLHDLNVLHDAAGLPGSLHIQTTTSSPRFIVQYHRMQESIHRSTAEDPVDSDRQNGPSTAQLETAQQSTEETPEEASRAPEEEEEQTTAVPDDTDSAAVEESVQVIDDGTDQGQLHENGDHAITLVGGIHDGEAEQDHGEHEEVESHLPDLESEENHAVNTAHEEGPFVEDPSLPADNQDTMEEEDTDIPQKETLNELVSSGNENEHLNDIDSGNTDDHSYDQEYSHYESGEVPNNDAVSGEQNEEDDGSYEEEGEYNEDQDAGADFSNDFGGEVDDASSTEGEEDVYYQSATVDEAVTEADEVIPLEDAEEDESSNASGSQHSSPSHSRIDARQPVEGLQEADLEDDGEDVAHENEVGTHEDSNLDTGEGEVNLDQSHTESHVAGEISDEHGAVFDQQEFTEELVVDPDIPDLPDEPIAFGDWEDDGEFEYEEWDEGKEHSATLSNNESTATLSSKSSKRTFEEVEDSEEYGDWAPPSSPDPKRTRTL